MGRKLMFAVLGLFAGVVVAAVLSTDSSPITQHVGYQTVVTIQVERGPERLAKLLYDPPAWLGDALYGIGLLIAGLTVWGYRRLPEGERPAIVREMGWNVSVITSVGIVAKLLAVAGVPWLAVVVGGTAGGYAAGWAAWNTFVRALIDDALKAQGAEV